MKQLNGEPIATARMYLTYEFSLDEVDRVLSAPPEGQQLALGEVLRHKSPIVRDAGDVNSCTLDNFREGVGKSLVQHRERSLRALPAPTTPEAA